MNEQTYNPFEVPNGTFNPFNAEQTAWIDAVADEVIKRIKEKQKQETDEEIKLRNDDICKEFLTIRQNQPLAKDNAIIDDMTTRHQMKRNNIYKILKNRGVI